MEFTLQTIQGVNQYPMEQPISNAYLKNLKDMKIGAGKEQFSAGKKGLFLGAETFADAPFSVDMEGNLTAKKGKFSGELDAATGSFAGALSAATGTFTGKVEIKDELNNIVILIDPNG